MDDFNYFVIDNWRFNKNLDIFKNKLISKNLVQEKLFLELKNFNTSIFYIKSSNINLGKEYIDLRRNFNFTNYSQLSKLNLSNFKFIFTENNNQKYLKISISKQLLIENFSYFYNIYNTILSPMINKTSSYKISKLILSEGVNNNLLYYKNESFWIKPEKINDIYGLNKKNLLILSLKNNFNQNLTISNDVQLWLKDLNKTGIFCPLKLIDHKGKLNFPVNLKVLKVNQKYKLIFACRFKNLQMGNDYSTIQPLSFKLDNSSIITENFRFNYNSLESISHLGYKDFFN